MLDRNLLHDATVVDANLDWRTGEARVRLRLGAIQPRPARLVVSDCVSLVCPRRHPWGASVSINEVRESATPGGGVKLEIEIQSGDVFELEGSAVALVDETP